MPHLFSKMHGWANGLKLDRFATILLLAAMFSLGSRCRPPTPTPAPTPTPTPGSSQRIPVLLVTGHSGDADQTWIQPANGTSFSAAVAANPQLPINVSMPVPGIGQTRSIADDATDVLAIIEGGLDSQGRTHGGLLNQPVYQAVGRVAIIAYSQGALSSRYYIKNLMGSRRNGAITVSEFVTLAAPNHGVGTVLACGNLNEPNRSLRELCAGHMGLLLPRPCNQCLAGTPLAFTTNQPGDDTFITDLNGHALSDSCAAGSHASEAPFSRPARADGILYVNLYGTGDLLVGDGTQSGDCFGRRLARNLAPDADNREFINIPLPIHANVPHHWEAICTALKTVTDHQAPAAGSPCAGLTHP